VLYVLLGIGMADILYEVEKNYDILSTGGAKNWLF
jgi:hypothetical protein